MKDVFISYKTEEFDEANWVRSTLENNGITCWMAPMCIPGGSSYAVEIPQAIKGCKVFVLILSERSQTSKWVPRELDQAINEGKIIMPFMLENCALKDDFNFYLTNVQRYNAYESKAATMEKMITEIKAVLGQKAPEPVPVPAEPEPEEPASDEPELDPVPVPEAPKPETPSLPKPQVGPLPPPKGKTAAEDEAAPKGKTDPAGNPAPKQKKKPLLFVAIGVVAAIVAGVLLSVITASTNTIIIAGEKFSKSDYSVTLEAKTLTQEDIRQFLKFDDLSSVCLTSCTLEGSLQPITSHALTLLQLKACGVTQEQLETLTLTEDIYRLDLSGNGQITDLAPLALGDKRYLYELKISDTGVTDISAVGALPKLETLHINRLELTDLKALERCIYLEELHAVGNALTTLEGLENTSKLTKVYLNGNKLTDITPLAHSAETLTVLQVNDNALTTLDALKDCAALQYVSVDRNQLTDITGLSNDHPSLAGLSAADNQLVTVREGWMMAGENGYLDLSGNQIEGVVALLGENQRMQLDLSDNPGAEWAYVKDATYANLLVWGTPAAEDPARRLEVLLTNVTGNTVVLDYGEGMENAAAPEEINIDTIKVVDCPLSAQVAMQELLGTYRVEFITADEAAGLTMSLPYALQYEE